ncbi:MAG TPA: helix-turn-helix domain-containing protein, partial [Acidimicrobiales bacterium]|nr:helix-turn-helix domain-containing protein [Acidimicrobiales bacterium]
MQIVQSIDRAFQILTEVADDPSGISEISRRLGLPTSTVARLLATLEQLGAVERLADDSGYRIGPSVVTMAASVDTTQSLLAVAQPTMQELVDLVAEAVGLSIPAGYDVHYIGQIDCANPVQVRDWTGVSLPMHIVPSGMVVLAHWPDEAVDRYLNR